MLFKLSITLVLLGFVASQTKYCCGPPQFETMLEIITGGLNNGKSFFVQTSENISLDSSLHKVAVSLRSIVNGVVTDTQLLQDYDAGKQYTVTNGVCQTSPLEPWTPKCIPDNAELLQKTYIGTGDKQVGFDVYRFSKDTDTYYVDVEPSDCVPLAISASGSKNNGTLLEFSVGTYGNATIGIKDPSVFNIPESCKHQPFNTHVYDLRPGIPNKGVIRL